MAHTARDMGGGLAQAIARFNRQILELQVASFLHAFIPPDERLAPKSRRWRSVSAVMQPGARVTGATPPGATLEIPGASVPIFNVRTRP